MQIILKDVRLSFPDLFEAKAYKDNPGKRFRSTFLIDPKSANHAAIEAAIQSVATTRFEKKAASMLQSFRGNANKFCYLDGNLKEYAGYEGMMYLAASRKEEDGRPQVIDRNGTPLTPADGKPYGGCYVNAIVDIYAQTGTYPGIRCSLLGVQFLRDGESFGGAVRLGDDAFAGLIVPDDATDDLM